MNIVEPVVRVSNVTKSFILHKEKSLKDRLLNFRESQKYKEKFLALNNVSLEIFPGTTVGLIGHNGSGKSTLLKVIGGIIQPTNGEVLRRGRMAALLELGAGFHPDLTGRENIYLNASILGLSRNETEAKFEEIVEFSGIRDFIDSQVKFYSSGMYVRLGFAIAVHSNPDLLIVDEVLAVGDEPFQQKCLAKIREFQERGVTIVFVSHDLPLVTSLCNRVIVLAHGEVIFDGNAADGVGHLRTWFTSDLASKDETSKDSISHIETSEVLIEELQLSISSDNNKPYAEYFDEVSLLVSYSVRKPLEYLQINIEVKSGSGLNMFSTSSEATGTLLNCEEGKHLVRIKWPSLPLGNGTYLISVSFADKNYEILSKAKDSLSLIVKNESINTGLSFLPTEITQVA